MIGAGREADLEGFSPHAKVAIEGHDRAGLERRCRCVARPAIAGERLSRAPNGAIDVLRSDSVVRRVT